MDAVARFRSDLKAGRVLIGAGITFSDPLVSDALGSSVDFLWIDMEHGGFSPEVLSGHLLACRARNIPGIVRVPGGTTSIVKPVLDSGADGIIVPQVRNVDEVLQLVNDCRYPPLGRRGFGPRVPSNYFRTDGQDFISRANENVFVAVMIETAEALASLDEILAVPGLDSVVIGPKDLSWSIGALGDVQHPKTVAAIDTIIDKALAAGRFVGAGMGPDAEFAFQFAKRGVQWLQIGQDCSLLVNSINLVSSTFHSYMENDPASVSDATRLDPRG